MSDKNPSSNPPTSQKEPSSQESPAPAVAESPSQSSPTTPPQPAASASPAPAAKDATRIKRSRIPKTYGRPNPPTAHLHPNPEFGSPEFVNNKIALGREYDVKVPDLALLYLKHGSMKAACREMWPEDTEERNTARAANIPKTRRFEKALLEVRKAFETTTELSVHWVLMKLKHEAMHAKSSTARTRAAVEIGKHLGMFIERKEIRSLKVDLSRMPTHELMAIFKKKLKVLK